MSLLSSAGQRSAQTAWTVRIPSSPDAGQAQLQTSLLRPGCCVQYTVIEKKLHGGGAPAYFRDSGVCVKLMPRVTRAKQVCCIRFSCRAGVRPAGCTATPLALAGCLTARHTCKATQRSSCCCGLRIKLTA